MGKKKYREFKRGQVVYADLGKRLPGVEGGLRPCVVVSSNESNHCYAPQITLCPLSSKLKNIPVHVQIKPEDVKGYPLKTVSDLLPEDIQTISKTSVRAELGYISETSAVMTQIDYVLLKQLGLYENSSKLFGKNKREGGH